MDKTPTIPVTIENSRYSRHLSSFRTVGPTGFTLVVGVARARDSKPVGHVDSVARFAFATINREEYTRLWRQIWSSPSGSIQLSQDDTGRIRELTYLNEKNRS